MAGGFVVLFLFGKRKAQEDVSLFLGRLGSQRASVFGNSLIKFSSLIERLAEKEMGFRIVRFIPQSGFIMLYRYVRPAFLSQQAAEQSNGHVIIPSDSLGMFEQGPRILPETKLPGSRRQHSPSQCSCHQA